MKGVDGNLTTAEILVRAVGAAGGALVSILWLRPNSWWEGLSRFGVSVIVGTVFAPVVLDYFGWWNVPDRNIAAACLMGIVAWWAVGLLVRILQSDWLLRMLPGNGRAKG